MCTPHGLNSLVHALCHPCTAFAPMLESKHRERVSMSFLTPITLPAVSTQQRRRPIGIGILLAFTSGRLNIFRSSKCVMGVEHWIMCPNCTYRMQHNVSGFPGCILPAHTHVLHSSPMIESPNAEHIAKLHTQGQGTCMYTATAESIRTVAVK